MISVPYHIEFHFQNRFSKNSLSQQVDVWTNSHINGSRSVIIFFWNSIFPKDIPPPLVKSGLLFRQETSNNQTKKKSFSIVPIVTLFRFNEFSIYTTINLVFSAFYVFVFSLFTINFSIKFELIMDHKKEFYFFVNQRGENRLSRWKLKLELKLNSQV